jgi:hypothetical protein
VRNECIQAQRHHGSNEGYNFQHMVTANDLRPTSRLCAAGTWGNAWRRELNSSATRMTTRASDRHSKPDQMYLEGISGAGEGGFTAQTQDSPGVKNDLASSPNFKATEPEWLRSAVDNAMVDPEWAAQVYSLENKDSPAPQQSSPTSHTCLSAFQSANTRCDTWSVCMPADRYPAPIRTSMGLRGAQGDSPSTGSALAFNAASPLFIDSPDTLSMTMRQFLCSPTAGWSPQAGRSPQAGSSLPEWCTPTTLPHAFPSLDFGDTPHTSDSAPVGFPGAANTSLATQGLESMLLHAPARNTQLRMDPQLRMEAPLAQPWMDSLHLQPPVELAGAAATGHLRSAVTNAHSLFDLCPESLRVGLERGSSVRALGLPPHGSGLPPHGSGPIAHMLHCPSAEAPLHMGSMQASGSLQAAGSLQAGMRSLESPMHSLDAPQLRSPRAGARSEDVGACSQDVDASPASRATGALWKQAGRCQTKARRVSGLCETPQRATTLDEDVVLSPEHWSPPRAARSARAAHRAAHAAVPHASTSMQVGVAAPRRCAGARGGAWAACERGVCRRARRRCR